MRNLKLVFAFVIIISFYSFGTFGFFNLFGLATGMKILVIIYLVVGLICFQDLSLRKTRRWRLTILSLIVFGYYGFFTTILTGNILNGLVNSLVMWIIYIFLIFVEKEFIYFMSKCIVFISTIFSVMGFFVFVIYALDYGNMAPESKYIFDSSTGNQQVVAASFYDYLSFSSGDGYVFFGHIITRVKGFSNEPSSALVHYMAPIILAFFLGKKYNLCGYILLGFMFIAVASLVGILAIVFAIFVYLILLLPSRMFQNTIFLLGLLTTIIMLTHGDFMLSTILNLGQDLNSSTGYDLIARKEGSATIRLAGFSNSISTIMSHPFGGSGQETLSGLLLQLGLVGGFPLIIAASMCLFRLFIKSRLYFSSTSIKTKRYAVSLLLSMVLIVTITSGYGWDRLPGIIMILLIYRSLDTLPYNIKR